MKTATIIIGLILNFTVINGQKFNNAEKFYRGQKFYHDTLFFNNYKGVICDSNYAPFASRNVFPKNRFKPTIDNINTIEEELIIQYSNALRLFYTLSFNNEKETKDDYSRKEYRGIKHYYEKSNIDKLVKNLQEEFEKQFHDFDREYYGYIGLNKMRYIKIIFVPHEEKYVEIPGTGEAILDNLPCLTYNLDTNVLYLAGWTGENDE